MAQPDSSPFARTHTTPRRPRTVRFKVSESEWTTLVDRAREEKKTLSEILRSFIGDRS